MSCLCLLIQTFAFSIIRPWSDLNTLILLNVVQRRNYAVDHVNMKLILSAYISVKVYTVSVVFMWPELFAHVGLSSGGQCRRSVYFQILFKH